MQRPARLLLVALLAFALRLTYATATGALWHPEHWEVDKIATNLLEGRGFVYDKLGLGYRSYAEPMYPFFAAAIYTVTHHSRTALVVVQLIIASFTVWLAGIEAWVATRDEDVALLTAAILAIHPGLIRYSTILHPFVLDVLFFVAAAVALLRYERTRTLPRGCVAAVLIGLGALTRPTILVFLVPLIWIAWHSSLRLRGSLTVIAIAIAMVAPWTIRNAVVHHTFMLTRSGSGYVFWLGNHPNASGSATDQSGRDEWLKAPEDLRHKITQAGETTRDQIFAEEAWTYIREKPAAAVNRVLLRIRYFWWFSPQWGHTHGSTSRIIYQIWWGTLLLLIAAGCFALRKAPLEERRSVLLLVSMAMLISILQSIYYVEGRHRLAVEPLIVPLAAMGAKKFAATKKAA